MSEARTRNLRFVQTRIVTEFRRLCDLEVDWVLRPTSQPWGTRSMVLRSPGGVLINVSSRERAVRDIEDGA